MIKLILISAILLSSCAAIEAQRRAEIGGTTAYQDGYMHGCRTGNDDGNSKDVHRYINDDEYKVGWDDGYRVCAANLLHLRNVINSL